MGMNTASVVMVEAVTAIPTSEAPSTEAFLGEDPSSVLCLKMFSSTTMELSTSIPMERARPARETMLRFTPKTAMIGKVSSTERGIESPTVPEVFHDPRKNTRTITEMITACTPVFARFVTEPLIILDWS